MSIERSVYIGPYLECRVENILVTRTLTGCPMLGCRGMDTTDPRPHVKWCPTHGKLLGPVERVVSESKVDPWEASEAIDEALSHVEIPGDDDRLYWLPNDGRNPPREFSIDGEDLAIDLSDPGLAMAEIEWFRAVFLAEIDRLREMYGAGSVRLAWGIVAYSD